MYMTTCTLHYQHSLQGSLQCCLMKSSQVTQAPPGRCAALDLRTPVCQMVQGAKLDSHDQISSSSTVHVDSCCVQGVHQHAVSSTHLLSLAVPWQRCSKTAATRCHLSIASCHCLQHHCKYPPPRYTQNTHTHIHTHTHTRTPADTRTHTRPHAHRQTDRHTHTHTRTHVHVHIHTHLKNRLSRVPVLLHNMINISGQELRGRRKSFLSSLKRTSFISYSDPLPSL